MKKRFPVECDDVRGTFLDPHRKKTINRVTQRLAPKLRDRIRQLWKTANVMDLNYSNLDEYLSVINQRFEEVKRENTHRRETHWKIKRLAELGARGCD